MAAGWVTRAARLLAGPVLNGRSREHRVWTSREDQYLAAWWGLMPDPHVAAILGRTVVACALRAKRGLGIARKDNILTGRQVARVFGVDPTTPYRLWRQKEWLRAEKAAAIGCAGGVTTCWSFSPLDLEAFVRDLPWAYAVDRMEPGHWLTDLAREVHDADPWLTTSEASRIACVLPNTVAAWCLKGWVPSQKRPHYGQTTGPHGGHSVVRRSDLLAYLAAQPAREWERRSDGAKRRWVRQRKRSEQIV